MAAILRDSVVAVVRTRPRAIPLAMITMSKILHGFPFLPYMGMGLRLAAPRAAGAPLWISKQTANIWQFKENTPTLSPILTRQTAEPARARRIFLEFNSRTKVSRKNNSQYWSLFPRKRPKEYRCQARVLNKRFQNSMISIDQFWCKNCLPAIETYQTPGLVITLAAPRKYSFDSHDECRNRSRNDNLPPFAAKNVSFIAPVETTYDWWNTVTWAVSYTAWVLIKSSTSFPGSSVLLEVPWLQPRSQGLSSYRPLERTKRDPGWVWSRVS